MKGREGTKGAPPTDLLVCFPSRSHLSLMPKQICSPVRPIDGSKRHHQKVQNHHHHLHNQKGGGGGQGSPLLWAKTTKAMGSEMVDEPTSPKVTCAGQIKVRPKPSSCKNWQSVMEEIERLHKHNNNNARNNKHKNKKASWGEALGFKKDVMQFLTCLRGLRFDLRCFGSFQGSDVISDDDDEDEDEEGEEEESEMGVESSSRTVFSKWYMVLQDNQNNDGLNKDHQNGCEEEEEGCESQFPSAPPPNALLLMRCRSAPAKSWLEEKEEEEEEKKKKQQKEEEEEEEMKAKVMLMEEEKRKENLILRCYSPDFFKVSSDVAKETWVVGGVRDQLSRSRSWKR